MHTGIISFADKTALNIKSQDVKKDILDDIEQICNIKIIQKHFDKLTPNLYQRLNTSPHLISLKTNGNPYFLYLTKVNFINQCIFIDKKVQSGYFLPRLVIARFGFDNELFNNTLFDGEMLKDDNNNWLFLINDIIIKKNEYLNHLNLLKRLDIVHDIFNNYYKYDKNDICVFQIKKYVKYNELKYLTEEFLPKLNYSCRGLYFKPLYLKFKDILYNFDDSLIIKVNRIKYQSNSIDDKCLILPKKIKIDDIETNKYKMKSTNSFNSVNSLLNNNNNSCSSLTSLNSYSNKLCNDEDTNKKNNNKIFIIEKTNLIDVFNIYDPYNNNKKEGIACIPTLSVSKYLHNTFKDINFNNKIKFNCEYSSHFNKWIPISIVE